MNLSTALAEISCMSIEDRIKLVQAIWDTIDKEHALLSLSDGQKRDLDRRMADLDAFPENVLTWEEIREKIRDGQ